MSVCVCVALCTLRWLSRFHQSTPDFRAECNTRMTAVATPHSVHLCRRNIRAKLSCYSYFHWICWKCVGCVCLYVPPLRCVQRTNTVLCAVHTRLLLGGCFQLLNWQQQRQFYGPTFSCRVGSYCAPHFEICQTNEKKKHENSIHKIKCLQTFRETTAAAAAETWRSHGRSFWMNEW